jgi:hypothetical protein
MIGYEGFLSDPVASARRLFDSLSGLGAAGLKLPEDPVIREWLDSGLLRQRAREDELKDHLNEPQQRLYEALKDGSALGWKSIPPLSPSSIEALENHEQEDLQTRNKLKECQQARSYLLGREEYLMEIARQFGNNANEMEPYLNELSKCGQCRLCRGVLDLVHALTRKPHGPRAADQLRSLVDASKALSRQVVMRAPKSAGP